MNTSPSDPPEDNDPLEEVWKDVRVPGNACAHPRAKWYADREYVTTFCGVCHKNITAQMDELLRIQGFAPVTTTSGDPGQDNVGRKVRVLVIRPATDFTPEARVHARVGRSGSITDYSNSHGLCYAVLHEEGLVAWYNPEELVLDE